MSAGRITIGEVEAAINRARAALASVGAESALTVEVSVLAGLYGRLIWARRDDVSVDARSPAERLAIRLWQSPAGERLAA